MNQLLDLIKKYEMYVERGNQLLIDYYKAKKSPLIAKREGIIPSRGELNYNAYSMKFSFHGMGCRFVFDNVIVDFDYAFKTFEYKGFEVDKLFCFVQSSSLNINKKVFNESLKELEVNNLIRKKSENSIDTYDYVLV